MEIRETWKHLGSQGLRIGLRLGCLHPSCWDWNCRTTGRSSVPLGTQKLICLVNEAVATSLCMQVLVYYSRVYALLFVSFGNKTRPNHFDPDPVMLYSCLVANSLLHIYLNFAFVFLNPSVTVLGLLRKVSEFKNAFHRGIFSDNNNNHSQAQWQHNGLVIVTILYCFLFSCAIAEERNCWPEVPKQIIRYQW